MKITTFIIIVWPYLLSANASILPLWKKNHDTNENIILAACSGIEPQRSQLVEQLSSSKVEDLEEMLEILEANHTGIRQRLSSLVKDSEIDDIIARVNSLKADPLFSRLLRAICRPDFFRTPEIRAHLTELGCSHIIFENLDLLSPANLPMVSSIVEDQIKEDSAINWSSINGVVAPLLLDQANEQLFTTLFCAASIAIPIAPKNDICWITRFVNIDKNFSPLEVDFTWLITKLRRFIFAMVIVTKYNVMMHSTIRDYARWLCTLAERFQSQSDNETDMFASMKRAIIDCNKGESNIPYKAWSTCFVSGLAEDMVFGSADGFNLPYESLALDVITLLHYLEAAPSDIEKFLSKINEDPTRMQRYPPALLLPTLSVVADRVPLAAALLHDRISKDPALVSSLPGTRNLMLPLEIEVAYLENRLSWEKGNWTGHFLGHHFPFFRSIPMKLFHVAYEDARKDFTENFSEPFKTICRDNSELCIPLLSKGLYSHWQRADPPAYWELASLSGSLWLGIKPAVMLPFEFLMLHAPVDDIIELYYPDLLASGGEYWTGKSILTSKILPILARPWFLRMISDEAYAYLIYGTEKYRSVVEAAKQSAAERQNLKSATKKMAKSVIHE